MTISFIRSIPGGTIMAIDRKAEIIKAATESFSLYGYKNTTMDQVARLANVGKGTIYTFAKRDRKSTRLNSSHVAISYAVFCLKKKKKSKSMCVSNSEC